jgi:FtsH-binding integral membrane protein
MALIQLNTAAVQDRSDFVSKVYTTLGVSLLFCCAGAYFGLSMPPSLFFPIIILEFILLFACMILQRSYPLNLLLLALFTTCSGLTLGPVLTYYVVHGMGNLIPVAAGTTAVTFGALSTYVHVSKKDFSFLGGFLFIALIGMILVGLAGMLFRLPINETLYGGIGVVVFSGFILFDTSNILRRYQDDQYVAAALGLYLDIINLFLSLLRLMSGQRR